MSTTIPTTISICIATTLSCFTLFTLTSDQDRVDMQTASEGFAQSIKILSPTTIGDQCWQIDDRFAKHLPDGSIWTVEINQDDEDCDQAKLQIQLPESNTTFVPVSPTATNITLKEGTVTWSESLNHSDIESPYKARLVGAQTAPDRCLILKCGGDVRGVDITPAIASLTNAIDNVKPITGNLLKLETNATNDPSLDLGGRCENESAKVTIYNDRTKLAEVNCNCSNSEDNTEAKAKTATTTKIETKTTTDTKQESKCSWAYEVSIVHGNTYQFNVTESDWINNISPATANFEVTVDTEAPRVSALTLAPKILTKNKEAEVTLTFSEAIADFESDKHITIQNGTLTTMERKDVEGKKWTGTLTPENDIVAIDNVVKVNGAYIDIAGNIGSPYQSESYIIDTRDLAAPSFSLDKDTGISNADNITYNRQVNVNTDVVVPGAKWKYSLDSGQNWEVSSDSKMFFLAENAKYEPGSIQVQQISEFGNLGTISKNPEKIIIDNMRPAPPSLALVNDTGRYSNDNITSDAKVSVEIEQNASWQYRHKKAQDWQDGSDKNFFELIPNTTYKKDDIHVIQTDVAGNNSDKDSNQADFIIDNIAPVPLGFTIADDTGTNATDNITNNPQMNINSAVLEPDAIWHYSLDAGKSWTEGSGYHFDLNPGTYLAADIQVTQTDLAGNTSPVTNQEYKTPTLYLPSGAGSSDSDSSDGNDKYFSPVNEEPIFFDDTPPTSTISFALNKDTGSSSTDFITKNPQMDVRIEAMEEGAIWEYSVDKGESWQTSKFDNHFYLIGNRTYPAKHVQARVTDIAGNSGTVFKHPQPITIDNDPPNPPSFELDYYTESDDHFISQSTQINVFNLEPGAIGQYQINSADNDDNWVTVNNDSPWFIFDLKQNQKYNIGEIKVRQIDEAGNISDSNTNQVTFVIDNEEPPAPSFTLAHDTGISNKDNITQNPLVNVAVEENAIWHYRVLTERTFYGITTWLQPKTWERGSGTSFMLPSDNGKYKIQLKQRDRAGNESPIYSSNDIITIDNTAPAQVLTFALEEDTGKSSTDFITKNPQMNVLIEAMEEGAIWEYSVDNGKSWQTSKFDNHFYLIGNRTYPAKHVQARVTDIAGNSGTVFKHPQQIIIDNKAPNPPSFELDYYTESDDHFISQSTQINVFNLEPGAIGQYQINSADNDDNWVTVLNESPWFIFDLKQNQKYNIGEIKVRQIDEAGNISDSNTNQVTFVIDNEEPPAPSFTLAHDTGISNKDNITQNPLVNVAVEENAIWHYRAIVQQTAGENTIDSWKEGSGASFMLPSDNGKYKIQLKQRDRAGNVSPIYSSNDIITIDNTAPAQVLTFALDEDTGISDRDNITQSRWLRINNISELNGELPWEYRLGNGNNWISGDKDTILLEKNTVYQAGSIQLRHYDMAGNPSRAFSNSDKITIDNEAPSEKLSFALRENTGIRNSDTLIRTRNPLVVVDTQLLEEKASWQYSLDGGEIWANGTNGRFVLRDHEIYLADKIQVRQVDLAGNHGPVNSNKHHIKIDTIPPYNKLSFKLDEDTGVSDSDYITSNPLIVIDTKLLDGIETIWQYSLNGGKNWEDGANGQFTLDESGVYATGSIQVRQVDFAGNLGPIYSNRQAIEVDTIRPDSLSFTLEEDTGIRNNDYFTQNPKVIVDTKMLENDARWEYSSDGGKEWAGGANGQFELGDNEVYATGSIQVRQVDLAGNLGHVYSNKQAIKIDNNPPTKKLYFYLQSKNVVGWGGMNFTQNPLVNVGTNNLEKDAIWRYSLDGGNNWVDGANSQFMLSDNMYYDIGSIQVRQVDFAGNLGPVYSNHRFPFVIDNLAPTFPSNKVVVSLDKSAALRWNIASLPNTFAEDENKVFYRVSGKDSALIEDMVYTKNGQEVLSTYIFKSNIYKDDTKKYTYNFIVTAYDMAGNTAEQEFTVYINFPPTWREIEYSCDSKIGIQKIGSVCQAGWHNGVESTSCDVDSDPARTIQCAKDGTWSEWSDWSRCSDKGVTCGGTPGKQFRTRECSATRGGRCETNGPTTETRSCTLPYCSLVNEKHNDKHCEDLGGRVTRVFEGLYDAKYICAFSRSSCPSGWKQYKNWSITEPSSCWIQSSKTWCGGFTGKGDGCTTTYHKFFRDIPPETCTYTKIQSISAGLLKRDCTSVDYTCTAKIKEIACY